MPRPLRKAPTRRSVMPKQIPQTSTNWELTNLTTRKLEPAEQLVSQMTRPPTPLEEPPPSYEPTYMLINLTQISKRQYTDASKSENITARRPLGFIVGGVSSRIMYVNEEDEYYEGPITSSYYTERMFTERETKGVEKITRIVFTKIER
jgi:hypothetical protein